MARLEVRTSAASCARSFSFAIALACHVRSSLSRKMGTESVVCVVNPISGTNPSRSARLNASQPAQRSLAFLTEGNLNARAAAIAALDSEVGKGCGGCCRGWDGGLGADAGLGADVASSRVCSAHQAVASSPTASKYFLAALKESCASERGCAISEHERWTGGVEAAESGRRTVVISSFSSSHCPCPLSSSDFHFAAAAW